MHVRGPATITFTDSFEIHSASVLKADGKEYKCKDRPPQLDVGSWKTVDIVWTSREKLSPSFLSPSTCVGWSCNVERPQVRPCEGLTASILVWARSQQAQQVQCDSVQGNSADKLQSTGDAETVFSHLLRLYIGPRLRRLLVGRSLPREKPDVAVPDVSSRHRKLFESAFSAVLAALGVGFAVKLLNTWSCPGEVRPQDATSIMIARTWAAQAIEQVVASSEWCHIEPDAMVDLVREVVEAGRGDKLSPARLMQWAREGYGLEAEEALSCIAHLCPQTEPASKAAKVQQFLRSALCACLAAEGEAAPSCVCKVLRAAFGPVVAPAELRPEVGEAEGPPAKRRRTLAWLGSRQHSPAEPAGASKRLGAASMDLGEAALSWVRDADHFQCLGVLEAWCELPPLAMLRAARAAPSAASQAMQAAVTRWAGQVDGEAVFEALTLAMPEQDAVLEALHAAAKDRFLAAERQNALLEGGKFRQELEAAVQAAKVATEAKLRAEFDAREAELRTTLEAREAERRRKLAAAQLQQLSIAEVRIVEVVKQALDGKNVLNTTAEHA